MGTPYYEKCREPKVCKCWTCGQVFCEQYVCKPETCEPKNEGCENYVMASGPW